MTDEQLQILKKELAARLPYDIYISYDYEDGKKRAYIFHGNYYYIMQLSKMKWENCKLYLRPMSSIRKEETDYLADIYKTSKTDSEYITRCNDYLLSHYLDYRGLIDMNLALPATNEMYNIE